MPLVLAIILGAMGFFYILFAFVKPPQFLEHFFRVPGLFVFLPDRLIIPVGRVAAGALLIGVTIFLCVRFPPG